MGDIFRNDKVNGIYKTRYIASWYNVGGELSSLDDFSNFKNWLSSLGLNEDDVNDIWNMAINGKLELERSAREFLRESNQVDMKEVFEMFNAFDPGRRIKKDEA